MTRKKIMVTTISSIIYGVSAWLLYGIFTGQPSELEKQVFGGYWIPILYALSAMTAMILTILYVVWIWVTWTDDNKGVSNESQNRLNL